MKRDAQPKARQDKLDGHVLIVEGRFYEPVCDELARGAIAALEAAGCTYERIAVPGALEIPGSIALADASQRFDAFVALGCVLRGETAHYDIVANESARGLMELTLQGVCAGNGILTCDTEAQAMARAKVGEGNKGGHAAVAALALLRLARDFAPDDV
jgi:6,7-dimethyl-8-ribityllumazine synthase